jgi:predicted phage terminase large subunit-like protein
MAELDIERMLRLALANPERARLQLRKVKAEEKLIDFIRLCWPILEPGRKFTEGWAVEAICEHLEAVTRGDIKRLLINVPPGCMKSLTTNVFWPAWEWGPQRKPSMRYVTAAYAEQLTIRDNRKCLALIRSPLYQSLWGDVFQLDPDQQAKTKFDTDHTGWKLATSVGGAATGERGDRVIIDDPHNVKEGESEAKREEALQWFTEVVPTRINDPTNSAMICIMQRVHEGDISGHILEHMKDWEHLCLPMEYELEHPHPTRTSVNFKDPRTEEGELLWPERFTPESLVRDKNVLSSWGGEYAVSGQFQQRPAPRGGGMFQVDKLTIIKPHEVPKGGRRVRGWDLAATAKGKGARTAGVLMRRTPDGSIYIEDSDAFRANPMGVYDRILACAKRDGYSTDVDLPQDPGQAGKSQKSHLAKLLEGYSFHCSPETGSKEDRARPLSAQVEAGKVFLVEGPWNERFKAEMAMFPAGNLKDQVDASTRAYARLLVGRDIATPDGGQVIGE